MKKKFPSISDCPQLNAPVPAKDTFGAPGTGPEHSGIPQGAAGRRPQDVRVPGDSVYGGDGVPEPAHHQVEDRLESVRQGIPRLV